MAKSNIMSILKILTDLCANAKHKIKNTFASIVYIVLLVKEF